MNIPTRMLRRVAVMTLALAAATLLNGCLAAGWLADGVVDPNRTVNVAAEYHDLENQRVAVLVDADPSILYQQPLVHLEVATAISNRLADNVEGITVRDPEQIIRFQQRNLYWNTARYSELMERLEVDRILLVELVDYRLHEPGNANIWRGLMTANIGVAEADSDRPDDFAYATTVSVKYPPNNEVGLLNADQRTIRLATLDLFSRNVTGKFYEHEQTRSD